MGMTFDLWKERVQKAFPGGKKHKYPGFPRGKKERKRGKGWGAWKIASTYSAYSCWDRGWRRICPGDSHLSRRDPSPCAHPQETSQGRALSLTWWAVHQHLWYAIEGRSIQGLWVTWQPPHGFPTGHSGEFCISQAQPSADIPVSAWIWKPCIGAAWWGSLRPCQTCSPVKSNMPQREKTCQRPSRWWHNRRGTWCRC